MEISAIRESSGMGHRGYESVIRNLGSAKVSAMDSRAEKIFALLHVVKIMSGIENDSIIVCRERLSSRGA